MAEAKEVLESHGNGCFACSRVRTGPQDEKRTEGSPAPGTAIGRMIVLPNVTFDAEAPLSTAASLAWELAFLVSIHLRNRSRVAIIPLPLV